jgi:autophagy-related protein 9
MNHNQYSLIVNDYGDTAKIDDQFLINLYIYFLNGGYYNIIINDITNICISIFLMLFFNFIYSCIDYNGLFTNTGEHGIDEYLMWHKFKEFDVFMIISLIIFIIYTLFRIIKLIQDLRKFAKTRIFYDKTLKIKDMEIRTYKWEDITEKLLAICHNVSNINVYTVTSRIMKLDNIFISLFDKKQIPFSYINGLMEWNIKHCFLRTLLEDNKISQNMIENRNEYKERVKKQILWVGIINLLFLPFILLFVSLYTIIEYGESFYNYPKKIVSRRWTRSSRWKFRFYNELPHLFEERMELASNEMNKYFNQFNYRILEIFSRLIVFIVSCIFLFLVLIVFINENNLTNKGFFGFQPVIWYMTILATILAIFKNFTKSNITASPMKSLQEANQYLKIIGETNIKNANSPRIRNKMAIYYQYQLICIIKQLVSIVATPIYFMPKLYKISDTICDFIIDHIENHYIMDNVSKFSIFTKYTYDLIERNPKLKYSIENFKESHIKWNCDNEVFINTIEQDYKMELPDNSIYNAIITIDSDDETLYQ